jgi:hypothetical protein
MNRWLTLPILVLMLAACSEPAENTADSGVDDDPDAAVGGDEHVTLLAGDWTMSAGTEGYHCVRKTIEQDLWIKEFKPLAPEGTHHTALAIDFRNDPDGSFPCDAGTVGFNLLFGSGIGTEPFPLPEGIAYKVPAGSKLLLNLHLYNVSDSELTGTSGVEVLVADPEDVVHEAETVYVLDYNLDVTPGESNHEVKCTVQDEATVFGVFPHMHRMGAHMTATIESEGGSPTVFFDKPYDFEEQYNHTIDPSFEIHPGDVIRGNCGFFNDTTETVSFGDSSDDEMCVLGIYRYPASGGVGLCTG